MDIQTSTQAIPTWNPAEGSLNAGPAESNPGRMKKNEGAEDSPTLQRAQGHAYMTAVGTEGPQVPTFRQTPSPSIHQLHETGSRLDKLHWTD